MGDFILKIGYIKLKKKPKSVLGKVMYRLNYFFNKIYSNRYDSNVFYVYSFKPSLIKKLNRVLQKNGVDYCIVEYNYNISYKTLDGKKLSKYMLPDIIKFCHNLIKLKRDEIYICVNDFNSENVEIISDIASKVRVLNIVTDNNKFRILERELEQKGIYITVSLNKRKALKDAGIVVNIDFESLNDYNINRNMIIIDVTQDIKISNCFDGIIIKKIILDTKKIMRVFNNFENFDRSKLIEAEIIKHESYKKAREYISINKFDIVHCINERKIGINEFQRISNKAS